MRLHEVISFEAYFHGEFDNRYTAKGPVNSATVFEQFTTSITKKSGDWSCSFITKSVTQEGEELCVTRIIKLDGKLIISHREKK